MRIKAACEIGDIDSLSLALRDSKCLDGAQDGLPTSKEWIGEEIRRVKERVRIEDTQLAESFGIDLLNQMGIDPSIISSFRTE